MKKSKLKNLWNSFLNIIHWEKSPKPEVDLSSQIWEELRPFRTPLILTVLTMLFGTLGYIVIDNFSLMDALYQTGITFTTVGFGEIAPISQTGRLFTIFLIIAGFAVFSYAVGVLVSIINDGKLIGLLKERRMLYKIARLKNHIVIFYHNKYTIELTNELRKAHIPFVVVDNNENLESIAREYKYPYFIKAEPHTTIAIKKAFLSSAKGVITLSQNTPDNIAVISSVRLYEKDLKRNPYYILSIAQTDEEIEKLLRLGANEVLSPTKLIAKRMTAITVDPDVNNLLEEFVYSIDTPLDLEEIKISKKSWISFKKIKEAHIKDFAKVSIIGIKEENGKFIPIPQDDIILKPNDKLLVIGASKEIKKVRKIVRSSKKPKELDFI